MAPLVQFLDLGDTDYSCHRNSVPKKFRGIDLERFSLFRGKSAPFTVFRVSRNIPLQGTNGTKFRVLTLIHLFLFVLEWFRTSFQRLFSFT
jgi:hypothetical protein